MKPPVPLFELPSRDSLSVQTATVIRKVLSEGTWGQWLPGERRLCEFFRVSRPVLRASLRQLAREGRLRIRHGQHTEILGGRPAPAHRVVGIVSRSPLSRVPQTAFQAISEMRAQLAERGFATATFVCPTGSDRAQKRRIAALVREHRLAGCAMMSVSRAVQEWFAENEIPALVLGSCHEGIALPSLAVDYRSVCRHAVGMFLRKRHTRLALVIPGTGLAGDVASEQGFLEAAAQRTGSDRPTATIVRHDGTARDLSSRLEALFRSAQAPTALLVAKPAHVFAVMVFLLQRGIPVPERVSLVGRDPDPHFETTDPVISHYRYDHVAFGDRVSRLMLRLARGGELPPEPTFVIPRFVAGGTVRDRSR